VSVDVWVKDSFVPRLPYMVKHLGKQSIQDEYRQHFSFQNELVVLLLLSLLFVLMLLLLFLYYYHY